MSFWRWVLCLTSALPSLGLEEALAMDALAASALIGAKAELANEAAKAMRTGGGMTGDRSKPEVEHLPDGRTRTRIRSLEALKTVLKNGQLARGF